MNEDIILQYISGSLSEEALQVFEEQLKQDESLQKDLKLYQSMVHHASTKIQVTKSVDLVKDVGKEFKPSQTIQKHSKGTSAIRYLIPTAIAAMLLIGFFVVPLIQTGSTNSKILDQSIYEVSPLSFSSRSAEANIIYEQAAKAFNSEDYENALQYLSIVLAGDPENNKAQFYKGMTLMRMEKLDAARETFESLIDHPLYIHASRYHTGLSFIKEEKYEPAKFAFESIPESSNYFKRAQKVLEYISDK